MYSVTASVTGAERYFLPRLKVVGTSGSTPRGEDDDEKNKSAHKDLFRGSPMPIHHREMNRGGSV